MLGADSPSLERRLGPFDAAAIVISNVIGVGIFITPSYVAMLLPNRLAILGVWMIGGALALFGAFAYAELAARQPKAGGEYVYLREAFGGLAAFLTGWTSFVAGFSGAIRQQHRHVTGRDEDADADDVGDDDGGGVEGTETPLERGRVRAEHGLV